MLIGYIVLLFINPAGAGEAIATVMKNFLTYSRPDTQMKYLGNTLVKTAPLLMCSLSILFAYKAGLFNIGASGQYTLGAFGALYCAIMLKLPWFVCLLVATILGGIWGAIPGFFKAYFNINEVITSIMFNWIGLYLVNELIYQNGTGPMYDVRNTRTLNLGKSAELSKALIPDFGLNKMFQTNSTTIAIFLAAVVANSSLSPVYQDFLLQELHLRIGNFNLFSHGGHPLKMIEFINDCLMTVFFLAVGLEIKRELLVGELSSVRKAALPFIAACGGMVVPVVIYALSVASGTPETRGMAIPMATDIAFSLGVLSLLGKRVPLSLKIFLTAFAVVDDIGGILVIALFYSADVAYGYLIAAAVLYVFLYYMGKFGVTQKIFFLFFGVIIWYLFLQSGIHSTISGVILAFVIPARPRLDAGKYIERIRDIIGEFPVSKSDNIVLTNAQIATLKQVERASDYVISPFKSL